VIRAGTTENYGMADFVDCLVAFDLEAVQLHIEEMRPGGFIVFDNTDEKIPTTCGATTSTGMRSRSARSRKKSSGLRSCATRFRSASSPR